MATYRIVKRNAIYRGAPGDEIVAAPGRQINAAIRAGVLTRIDIEETPTVVVESQQSEPEPEAEEEPAKKKRGRNG